MIRISIFTLLISLSLPLWAEQDGYGKFLTDFRQTVLIQNSANAQHDLQTLGKSLQNLKTEPDIGGIEQVQNQFNLFVKSWKSVETVYVLGAIDEDYLDHPRYIDYYHQGNESISDLVQRVLASDSDLAAALFKNSTKSINALEYLLFPTTDAKANLILWTEANHRRIDAAIIAVNYIHGWIEEIAEGYTSENKFIRDGKRSVGYIANALVESSYKLKNWRVGEAAGLVAKYQGKISPQRLEYYYSGQSLNAIIAILQTHRLTIHRMNSELPSAEEEQGASSEVKFILDSIDKALEQAASLPDPVRDHLASTAYKNFYQQIEQLHNAYFFMLIDSLGLNAKIIDADGD